MPFKETVFIRIKTEQLDKVKLPVPKIEPIFEILSKMNWSIR